VVKRGRDGSNPRGYWQIPREVRALGFKSVPCGPDGPEAWAIAATMNARLNIARRKGPTSIEMAAAAGLVPEEAEILRANAIINDVIARAQSFAPRSRAAANLAKDLPRVARAIKQAAEAA
jgi:hypothetical protein